MFRIKTWIPVEIDLEEDMQYITREAAEKEKAQLEEMQPENKYEIEDVFDIKGCISSQLKQLKKMVLLATFPVSPGLASATYCGNELEKRIKRKKGVGYKIEEGKK